MRDFLSALRLLPLRDRRGVVVAYAAVDAVDQHLAAWRWYRLANGYVVRTEIVAGRKRMVYLHRQITGLDRGPSHKVVDHVDHDQLNNRRANLRVGSTSLNMQNREGNAGRKLPRGVYVQTGRGTYKAQVKLHGKVRFLGTFVDPAAASRAVTAWREQYMPWSSEARALGGGPDA